MDIALLTDTLRGYMFQALGSKSYNYRLHFKKRSEASSK